MPHSLSDVLVHVIFSTKGRRPMISDDLKAKAAHLKTEIRATGLQAEVNQEIPPDRLWVP